MSQVAARFSNWAGLMHAAYLQFYANDFACKFVGHGLQMIMKIRRTDTFIDWFKGLKDREGRARIIKRLLRIEITGNLGDHASIGEGVFELRMHFGPGYRVYYVLNGAEIILLLGGGTKDTQPADIEKAKALARDI